MVDLATNEILDAHTSEFSDSSDESSADEEASASMRRLSYGLGGCASCLFIMFL